MFTLTQFLAYVQQAVQREGSQRVAAARWGLPEADLRAVLYRKRKPIQKLLKAVGVCRVERYMFVEMVGKEDR